MTAVKSENNGKKTGQKTFNVIFICYVDYFERKQKIKRIKIWIISFEDDEKRKIRHNTLHRLSLAWIIVYLKINKRHQFSDSCSKFTVSPTSYYFLITSKYSNPDTRHILTNFRCLNIVRIWILDWVSVNENRFK